MSPKDLCTIEILPQLLASGVKSLKIEGRMKSPDYVYTVVSTYRAALDRLQNCGDANYRVNKDEITALEEVFSRGFSPAYMKNKRGNDIMSYSRPNNRGINIGRVKSVNLNKVIIEVKEEIFEGDVLEV